MFYGVRISHGDRTMDKAIKRSKNLYILEAALEYFVAILVSGSFLATITSKLGFSDAQTGILSSIIALGSVFQLISITIRPKRKKPFVLILSILNQLLFTLLYVIPLPEKSNSFLKILFIAVIISAYFLYYIAHPKKIGWLMSLVDDKERGKFTANKEIVSLLLGMIFSFGMGYLVDYFEAKGEISTSLTICAITLFILTVLHTLTMIFTVEKDQEAPQKQRFFKSLVALISNKNILKVSLLFILWNISQSATTPFLSTYYLHDIGFSLTTITIITALGSVGRILISRFWGNYADKHSFAKMDMLCFGLAAIAFLFVVFSGPENGIFTVTTYVVLHAMALGGINSSLINLVFDYAPVEMRTDALAVTQVLGGLVGFFTTLVVSPFVEFVQNNENSFLGISVKAQQITSLFTVIMCVICSLYTYFVLVRGKKRG